ncbi:hypothetical protein R3P38DRAFT_2905255 [Favolaschia claudopus]|uniref:Uncharacterized protein n=1 Tax=Favolaschia claudopus TaxID=2862362 RepID=A0AAW0CDX9_9AGAR
MNRNVKASEPSAAPLRAKIAQFESKGGVPKPRGAFDSFGSAAPPQHHQQRRELYGNQMKPVWVPNAKAGASGSRNERREARRAGMVLGEKAPEIQLPSPPESPPAEEEEVPIIHFVESAEQTLEDEESPIAPRPVSSEQLSEEEELPIIQPVASTEQMSEEQDIPIAQAVVSAEQVPEEEEDDFQEGYEYVYEIPMILEGSDEEELEEEESFVDESPPSSPSSPVDRLPPTVTETAPNMASPIIAKQVPPLPPSPPLSPPMPELSTPKISPLPSRIVDLRVATDTRYGTVVIVAPPRTSSSSSTPASSPISERQQTNPHSPSLAFNKSQGQTFSSVVHPRVRQKPARVIRSPGLPAHPRQNLMRTPPTPSSPTYMSRMSKADLRTLMANAAELERKLVAGELPAEVVRRLSVRPVLVRVDESAGEEQRASRSTAPVGSGDAVPVEGKKHSRFRLNPLKQSARSKSRKRDKEKEESNNSNPRPGQAETTWFSDMSWRKLANTSRQKGTLESAPQAVVGVP